MKGRRDRRRGRQEKRGKSGEKKRNREEVEGANLRVNPDE